VDTPAGSGLAASLRTVAAYPGALLGLTAMAVAHTVMVAVMVMTPVHMGHGDVGLRVVGLVISVHVAGMFALSPVVGWLADAIGRHRVVLIGAGLLVLATAVAGPAGSAESVQLGVGLFLLGLGWSCALVAGSTLLTESVPLPSRPGVQGAADLVMGVAAGSAGALSGMVVGAFGYGVLNVAAAILAVPLLWRAAAYRPARVVAS
jgi:MFS family permease